MTLIEELQDAFPLHIRDELDTSFLIELLYFFPVDKVYISAGSYDQYIYDLEKTIIDNYDAGNFQVSYFYAHLIFMSYVYYCVERAYQIEPYKMEYIFFPINAYNGRNDKPDLKNYQTVYDFSKIPEKEIFKIFRILKMDISQINTFSNYISNRDNFAHATGKGNISEEALIQNVNTIKRNMGTLSDLFKNSLKNKYIKYLLKNVDRIDRIILSDKTLEFISDNALSLYDIKCLCHMGISNMRNKNSVFRTKYHLIKDVHCEFIKYCAENYGINSPENFSNT